MARKRCVLRWGAAVGLYWAACAAHVWRTGGLLALGLAWNMLLALLPLCFACAAGRCRLWAGRAALAVLWLLFLPAHGSDPYTAKYGMGQPGGLDGAPQRKRVRLAADASAGHGRRAGGAAGPGRPCAYSVYIAASIGRGPQYGPAAGRCCCCAASDCTSGVFCG